MGELQGQVSESADANDAYMMMWPHAVAPHRRVHRNACAQERCCARRTERLRNREGKTTVSANEIGESTMPPDTREHLAPAEILVAVQTPLTAQAAARLPPDAYSFTNVELLNGLSSGGHRADDFVSWHEGVMRDTPVVIDEVNVAVADTAVAHFDIDVVRAQFVKLIVEWLQRSPWRSCSKCVDSHGLLSVKLHAVHHILVFGHRQRLVPRGGPSARCAPRKPFLLP
jgi:hypothetical protein